MKIIELKMMRGPNFWSSHHHQLIVCKIDLEDLQVRPTHKIEGFVQRLISAFPSFKNAGADSFLNTVEKGVWMGTVVQHIALELQSLAGLRTGLGKTISGKQQGIYTVIFEYEIPEAGKQAAEAAISIAENIVSGEIPDVNATVTALMEIKRRAQLGPSTGAIVAEAQNRGIPFKRLNHHSLLILGYGNKQKKLRATVAGTTLGLGIEIAANKEETKQLLEAAYIPVPKGVLISDQDALQRVAGNEVPFPLVIKPLDGNHGRGITTNINTFEDAQKAFELAQKISNEVIVENFVEGNDYRLLLINYQFVAAAKRTPASITGNGTSTISELIDLANQDPRRGEGHDNSMTRIVADETTLSILSAKGLHTESILPENETLFLKHTANMSTGGSAEDVTDLVHPDNIFMAERVAKLVGLDICGIDVLAKDLSVPLNAQNGAVVEVNAGPGLRMHLEPEKGLPRNIAKPVIEMLFPDKSNGRIPIVAVTGTNGKTTTTRLIAHLARFAGNKKVGYTTTDGIYINGNNIHSGDCTGPHSCETVLFDPTIDFAVLECARGGLLRSGLAFTQSDISIVTNVSADHLGLKDIDTLEDMARVKMIVPQSTHKNGFAILNADDDLVYDMQNHLDCRIALFSVDSENDRIKKHCADGGWAAIREDEYLTICQGKWKTRIGKIRDFPITMDGRAEAMIRNLLPASLAGVLSGFNHEAIREALYSFIPSPELTPGRMNIFDFGDVKLMVDYAHNPDGMQMLKKFLDKTEASVKIGIVGAAGDRRDEDLIEMGQISAEIFDEIIIRHDEDLRGRTAEEMTEFLSRGVRQVKPDLPLSVISKETDAIDHAVRNAKPGAFITVCTEKVEETLSFSQQLFEEEQDV